MVVYTGSYRECEKRLGLVKQEVIDTFTIPDKEQKLLAQGLTIRLYVKRFEKYYLLMCGQSGMEGYIVDLVFKIKPDWELKEPLTMLMTLAEKFGLPVRIGQQKSRFIYNEFIPIVGGIVKLIDVSNPENHSMVATVMVKIIEQDGRRYAQCALGFAIDLIVYLKWLDT